MQDSFSGGSQSAPKGRRFAAALVDLVLIPIILGILIGFMLLAVPEGARSVVLVIVNIAWLIVRDAIYAPGRVMVGIKLVSQTGDKVSISQAFIRNVLIIIPFVLVVGYLIEIFMVFSKGDRLADSWAKTKVVVA